MKALKAHVHNGQIVLDEPIALPEGVAVEVLLPENDELTADERRELEDARAFARRLVAKAYLSNAPRNSDPGSCNIECSGGNCGG